MSAYAALISLKNTFYHIFCSCNLNLDSSSVQIIQSTYIELQQWETILQRLDQSSKSKSRKKVNALDERIKDIIWNFEDLLESLLSHQITLQSDESEGDVLLFSIDLHSLQDDLHSFIQALNNMKEEYIYEVDNMPEDEDEDEDDESRIFSSSTKTKMIGFSDQLEQIKRFLYIDEDWAQGDVYGQALVGMAGVGKTTLAREIYEDPEILSYFNFRLWITLGRKSSPRLNQDLHAMLAELEGDEKCLIVLDDVWKTEGLDYVLTSLLEMIKNTIVRVLLIARDQNTITYVQKSIPRTISGVVRFLNEDESMYLLCHKVFGEDSICPPQLVKAATKIAKKCEGLPLTIVTVADLLSKAQNNDPEYWEDVAEERNSVFKDAYVEISKVLYPSYDYLPQRFKMPFLFLGVFPRDYEIPLSKIINMLTAEGWFLDPDKQQDSPEESITRCVEDLCMYHNLALFKPTSTWSPASDCLDVVKTCRLHSSWQHLCREEARKNKFYHVLNRLVDASEESIEGQRCLCLENNLLFGITEFSNSVRLYSATSTRSLLFSGPYHQYPTPIDAIDFKLLRELDALQLRFYTFPTQVLALVQLKYLALTCNGRLPPTISKLFNLKVLIIHPHTSITKCYDTTPSYIPIQIWDMKELKHIEIFGKSLLTPLNHFASLEKLSTLVGVNAASICNISNRAPQIKKLGVQIELTPYDDVSHNSDLILSFFPHISILQSLETLKCSIINPVMVNKYEFLTLSSNTSSLILPLGLKKLHLSGMGFSWDYMDVIGSLPSLRVLKLRSYAFRGSKWETRAGSFSCLEFLLIEDSDLVQWIPSSGSFTKLNYLSMKHCYKLQELYWPSESGLGKIELVDCNPVGVSCAKNLEGKGDYYLTVTASDHFEA